MAADPKAPAAYHVIASCVASANAAMDAASRAIDLPGIEARAEVEISQGTRGGRTVTAEERDLLAENTIAELRQRLARLSGLYSTGSTEAVLDEEALDAAEGGE